MVPADAEIRFSVAEEVRISPLNVLLPILIRTPFPIALLPRPARESSRVMVCPAPLTVPPFSIRLPDSKPEVEAPITAIVPVLVPSCACVLKANTPDLIDVGPE